MIVPPTTGYFTTASSGNTLRTNHVADDRVQQTEHTASDKPAQRIPRPARSAYTEEQKFFIMYNRIVQELSWPEIENRFAAFFRLRSKDGLTSVYYRIRKDWGMEEVLKAESSFADDRGKVKERSCRFHREFLENLGYLDSTAEDNSCGPSCFHG